ncbi:cell division protein CrgA [Streptomyces sp. NPDC008121]|uniref:cell division protein CrgA n=1 Tax=Streptomyces sp. NPDC008121 TaxID=3364809 RepID=UPI0036E83816
MCSKVSLRSDFPWAACIASMAGLLGIAWISVYYVTGGSFPIPAWEKWNLVAGISLIVTSLVIASRQK